MPGQGFPHINLLFRAKGRAKLEGGGKANADVKSNKANYQQHATFLQNKFGLFSTTATTLRQQREAQNLPEIKGGAPFLLRIPDEDDGAIEFLAEKLGLEIVAEYEDGYLIVSSEDVQVNLVQQLIQDFSQHKRGVGGLASILEMDEDPLSMDRIKRILDERLLGKWPFNDADEFILDLSIEAQSFGFPKKPRISSRTRPQVREQKEAQYNQELARFGNLWEEKRIERETEIETFVQHYNGEIQSITDDSHIVMFPDSFSVRIKMSGRGFKDLIYNYPSLFEVSLPQDLEQPDQVTEGAVPDEFQATFGSPGPDSPVIGVIDSGIQEDHRLLEHAISDGSHCFVIGKQPDDVADYVENGGHGTRVASAILYPTEVPRTGQIHSPFWLLNLRVLNEHNSLDPRMFPPQLLEHVVMYGKAQKQARIYNHSIGSSGYCKKLRMSTWATAIDFLSYSEDVLFVQAAGNLNKTSQMQNRPGILEHLRQQRHYPNYLFENSSAICDPAQSLQALTVGSISAQQYNNGDLGSISPTEHPSSFTRTGFGLWNSIKPEVVEFGGDYVTDNNAPPAITNPPAVCPEMVRSTLNGGPAVSRDRVGTSFSAPKVTHIAGVLESLLPEADTLLYRALIVNSARWPNWADNGAVGTRVRTVRAMGYGLPSLSRATENTHHRITLITDATHQIHSKEGFVFGVPIPDEIRRPGDDYRVRIDVTLSYSAEPRRTRKSRRGYLGVWLDWKASKRNESFEAFKARALKDFDAVDGDDDGNFTWTLGNKMNRDGETDGVCRKNGTVQKDWTVAHSFELPDVFGVVVRGHPGWDRHNEDATAKFTLVVSFELLGAEVEIYELIQQAVEIQSQQQVEQIIT